MASIEKNLVTLGIAGTGSGKTIGLSHETLRAIVAKKINKSKLIVSIPTIVNARWQHSYAVKMMPELKKDIAMRAGGEGTENEHSARLLYATTQSAINILLNMYRAKKSMDDLIVMIDEAHHPSMENYILHGICNWLLANGSVMHVIITSATPSDHPFEYLKSVNKIVVPATQHHVTVHWNRSPTAVGRYDQDEMIRLVYAKVELILDSTPAKNNDILIFAAGEDVIEKIAGALEKTYAEQIDVFSAYSGMPKEEIDQIQVHSAKRKIIVGTNIVESGVTIDGIAHVIDMMRHKVMQIKDGDIEFLEETWISQASSLQRRGRAGRTRPGNYYPLCTEMEFMRMKQDIENEFYTMPKHIPVISMLARGLPANELLKIESTDYAIIIRELISLELITLDKQVTEMGNQITSFPTKIRTAITLLKQKDALPANLDGYHKMLYLTIMMAITEAKLSMPNIFFVPQYIRREGNQAKQEYIAATFGPKYSSESDFGVMMKVFVQMLLECCTAGSDMTFGQWNKDNGIVGKWISQSYRLYKQLHRLTLDGEITDSVEVYQLINDMIDRPDVIQFVGQALSLGYSKSIFTKIGYNGSYTKADTGLMYQLDNKSLSDMSVSRPSRIIALQTTMLQGKNKPFYVLGICIPLIDDTFEDELVDRMITFRVSTQTVGPASTTSSARRMY